MSDKPRLWEQLQAGNRLFFQDFRLADLPRTPSLNLAVVTCMDNRMNPLEIFSLAPGACNEIRNAGGRVTDDTLRSLVMSQQFLGTNAILILHHTNCGMQGQTDQEIRETSLEKLGPLAASALSTLTFHAFADPLVSVREDLDRLASSVLLTPGTLLLGAVYHVETGQVELADFRETPRP